MKKKYRILVLFPEVKAATSGNYLRFVDKLNELSAQSEITYFGAAMTELTYHIGRHTAIVTAQGKDLSTFDSVLFRNWQKASDLAATCASYLRYHKVPIIDSEPAHQAALTKLSEYMKLALAGITIPQTLLTYDAKEIQRFCTTYGNVIVKNAVGEKGKDNYLIQSSDEAISLVQQSTDKKFLIQEPISNNGDYRVMVAGGRITFVMLRQSQNGGHLNNISQGGKATKLDSSIFSPNQQSEIIQAANVLRREFAGVDVMIHTDTKESYILEVNYSPQVLDSPYTSDMIQPLLSQFDRLVVTKDENI